MITQQKVSCASDKLDVRTRDIRSRSTGSSVTENWGYHQPPPEENPRAAVPSLTQPVPRMTPNPAYGDNVIPENRSHYIQASENLLS